MTTEPHGPRPSHPIASGDDPVPQAEQPKHDSGSIPHELYEEVLRRVSEVMQAVGEARQAPIAPAAVSVDAAEDIFCPLPPRDLAQTGLSPQLVGNLILKWLYVNDAPTAQRVANWTHLSLEVVAEVLSQLHAEQLLATPEHVADDPQQPVTLNDRGRSRAVQAFSESRYIGPAPVSLSDYARQCRLQSPSRIRFQRENVLEGMGPLCVARELIDELGTALCGGRSLLLFGDSGNGKTSIARQLGKIVQRVGGAIYVPYAVAVERTVLTLFDPSWHRGMEGGGGTVAERADVRDDAGASAPRDSRWRRVQRPFVVAPPVVTAELFDFAFTHPADVRQAPLQVKANGGVLLIDDLGRQRHLAQLTDRWLRILEEGEDRVGINDGREVRFPIEQLTVFATHLSPAESFDSTFLRRVRSKVKVCSPDEHRFREIFRNLCTQRGIHYDDWAVLQCLSRHYNPQNPPKASDPQDLLDTIVAACRFVGESPRLTEDLLTYAYQRSIAFNDSSI